MSHLDALHRHCKALRLSTMSLVLDDTFDRAEREGWSTERTFRYLFEQEVEGRHQRRVERLLKRSHLPQGKTWAQFDRTRLDLRVQQQVDRLLTGDFVSRAENVLLFGLPGTGKTHLAAAIGHELTAQNRTVWFTPTFRLVGRLLKAKQELELERALKQLDRFDLIILDDIGYVQQSRDEMEVLFTFLSERYERRSLIITSNLVFSQWGQIFKNPLTTAAAIDRVVHHSTIIEFGSHMRSVRLEQAAQHNGRSLDRPVDTDPNTDNRRNGKQDGSI